MFDSSIGEVDKEQQDYTEKYSFFNQDHVIEGVKWNPEWVLSDYVMNTDRLIGKMDGSIPLNNITVYRSVNGGFKEEKRDLPPPQEVIYLDKSARPVEWLVRGLYPVLVTPTQDSEGNEQIPPMPHSRFLNIDKEDWLRRMGVSQQHLEDAPDSMVDFSKIDPDLITRLRSLFSTEQLTEETRDLAWELPTVLDGRHVMIVDEVMSSGQTLKIAQKLLSLAIPEATFSGQYWMIPERRYLNPGSTTDFAMKRVPAWYSNVRESGRGVSDKSAVWPERAAALDYKVSELSRLGRDFLSTPPHNPVTFERITDPLATKIRADITYLRDDIKDRKLFYRPARERFDVDEEAAVRRIEELNGMSLDEWKVKRDELEPKSRR